MPAGVVPMPWGSPILRPGFTAATNNPGVLMRTLPAGAAMPVLMAVLSLLGVSAASGAEPFCNRDCLAKLMDSYLQALLRHDPAGLPMTRNVKYSENGNNNWYGVRLKVEPGGKVSEIEVLISRSISAGPSGPVGGAPPKQNTEPHPLMAQVIPAENRIDRKSTRLNS